MKTFKFIFILFISITILGCSDNTETPVFTLSNANLAGTYNISSFNLDANITAETLGVSVDISKAKSEGDTFQVSFVLNANGTYTIAGQYRTVTTITPTGESPIIDTRIIIIDDSGTYEINTVEDKIKFNSEAGNSFMSGTLNLSGEFNIDLFNDRQVNLSQDSSYTETPLTTLINTKVNFAREES